jgi:hypothetical protein
MTAISWLIPAYSGLFRRFPLHFQVTHKNVALHLNAINATCKGCLQVRTEAAGFTFADAMSKSFTNLLAAIREVARARSRSDFGEETR